MPNNDPFFATQTMQTPNREPIGFDETA